MFSIIRGKKKGSSSSYSCNDDEGLRSILTELANANSNYVVVKPVSLVDQNHCYLKSCHLCHKPLSLDKEIYMYKGDLGFCTEECRDRQIYLDETNELEMYTKNIMSSFRERSGGGRCETYRMSSTRHPFSSGKNRVIFL